MSIIQLSQRPSCIGFRVPIDNRLPSMNTSPCGWRRTAACVKFVTSPLNPPTLPRDSMLRPPSPQRPERDNQPISPRQSELLLSPPLPPPPAPLPVGDPMDLSSAMAAVKGHSLKTEGVRKICEDWKLCFYCKRQHPGKSTIDCPNKKSTHLRTMDLIPEGPDNNQEKA